MCRNLSSEHITVAAQRWALRGGETRIQAPPRAHPPSRTFVLPSPRPPPGSPLLRPEPTFSFRVTDLDEACKRGDRPRGAGDGSWTTYYWAVASLGTAWVSYPPERSSALLSALSPPQPFLVGRPEQGHVAPTVMQAGHLCPASCASPRRDVI